MRDNKMKTITFQIYEAKRRSIKEHCARHGITLKEFIHNAINDAIHGDIKEENTSINKSLGWKPSPPESK